MGQGGHEFTRGSGSHVTGKIYGALDRCRGFIKNLVAGERCNVTEEHFEKGSMSE